MPTGRSLGQRRTRTAEVGGQERAPRPAACPVRRPRGLPASPSCADAGRAGPERSRPTRADSAPRRWGPASPGPGPGSGPHARDAEPTVRGAAGGQHPTDNTGCRAASAAREAAITLPWSARRCPRCHGRAPLADHAAAGFRPRARVQRGAAPSRSGHVPPERRNFFRNKASSTDTSLDSAGTQGVSAGVGLARRRSAAFRGRGRAVRRRRRVGSGGRRDVRAVARLTAGAACGAGGYRGAAEARCVYRCSSGFAGGAVAAARAGGGSQAASRSAGPAAHEPETRAAGYAVRP